MFWEPTGRNAAKKADQALSAAAFAWILGVANPFGDPDMLCGTRVRDTSNARTETNVLCFIISFHILDVRKCIGFY